MAIALRDNEIVLGFRIISINPVISQLHIENIFSGHPDLCTKFHIFAESLLDLKKIINTFHYFKAHVRFSNKDRQ